jgi:MFS family permease
VARFGPSVGSMTTTTCSQAPIASRPPLVTYALLLRFAITLGASTSFYILLSVVPLYAGASGAGQNVAGLTTGALMFATVAGELVTPRLTARYGYRVTLAAGLILLGAPALALIGSGSLPMILAVCVVRGLGFAITVVAGGAITASLIPAQRRGEGLALAGVVSGVPALAVLPLGVWLTGHVGYTPVFAAGAVTALAALLAIPGMPGRPAPAPRPDAAAAADRPMGILAGLRTAVLLRPAIVFAATTIAAGVIVTFLPLALSGGSAGLAAVALFAQPAASTVTRWLAGRHGDRHGPARLLIPGLIAAAAGMLVLALTSVPVAVIGGSLIFGAGFGVAQNASLSVMYERVPASGYDAVTALWNLSYDAGMGLGAVGFGVLAGGTGYPVAFAITAVAMLAALVPARRDLRPAARR